MKSLTIGYIPKHWDNNKDGSNRIDVGDIDFSNTEEVIIDIEDGKFDFFGSIVEFEKLCDAEYTELSKLVNNLKISKGWYSLSVKSLAAAFCVLCGSSAPHEKDKITKYATTHGPEIIDARKYRGDFYINIYDEETEEEKLLVFSSL